MTSARIRTAAREVLGTAGFRPGQAEAIEAVLERDTLAVLASGTGKTLVYTVAARLIDGCTLVISPTIALQHDQLRALTRSGQTAAILNASLPAREREQAVADFVAGTLEFLLLAPEQLANEEVLAELRRAPLSLFVVDEAHCISEWGQPLHEGRTSQNERRRPRPAPGQHHIPARVRCVGAGEHGAKRRAQARRRGKRTRGGPAGAALEPVKKLVSRIGGVGVRHRLIGDRSASVDA